jgi:hypothetical protein
MDTTNRAAMVSAMGISELMRTPEFRKLTALQASFVLKYIVSGQRTGSSDAIGAAAVAYKVEKDSKSARAFSYELLGTKSIRKVLDIYFGRPPLSPLDGLVADLHRITKRAEKTMKAVERHLAGKV